jgi:hypothetical protein
LCSDCILPVIQRPNFLLSRPPGPACSHRGRLCRQSCSKAREIQGATPPDAPSDSLAAGRVETCVRLQPTPERRPAGQRGNPHDVHLIIGKTGASRANDRTRPTLESPHWVARRCAEESETTRGTSMVQAQNGLATNCVVCCGRLQRTLKDGQADRRSNCRGVNRLETGTCAR